MGNLKKYGLPLLGILVVVLAGVSFKFYQELRQLKENPNKVAQEEVRALVARVGHLLVLPEGEDPTVATVNETEKLKEQPFFEKAKKGDKVLIYTNAKKAVLYDPVANKIVEVAPINIGPPAAPAPPAPAPAPRKP